MLNRCTISFFLPVDFFINYIPYTHIDTLILCTWSIFPQVTLQNKIR